MSPKAWEEPVDGHTLVPAEQVLIKRPQRDPLHAKREGPYLTVNRDSIERTAQEMDTLVGGGGINVMADLDTVTAEPMIENFCTNTWAAVPVVLKRATAWIRGMGVHRAVAVNMTSLLGSIELYWGEQSSTLKWFPCRASKVSLDMVTRCLAVDLQPDGILCVALHLGTDMGGGSMLHCQAPLCPEESITFILDVTGGLTKKDHGRFLHYTGEPLPW
ncbi:C-factor-like [Brienomyrus brachyistius]|uniref:C-factor-like n=1 Tax=Brienomyrus brachyistius TaxID=42636 RepID=UPI0020B44ADE|nr:C-factor-like [Brienomyrus brachyistius]